MTKQATALKPATENEGRIGDALDRQNCAQNSKPRRGGFERLLQAYDAVKQARTDACLKLQKIEDKNDDELFREPRVMMALLFSTPEDKNQPLYYFSHKEIDEGREKHQRAAQHLSPEHGTSDAWNERYEAMTRELHTALDFDIKNQKRFRDQIGWTEATDLIDSLHSQDSQLCDRILAFKPTTLDELCRKASAVERLFKEGVDWDAEKILEVASKDAARLLRGVKSNVSGQKEEQSGRVGIAA